jgi:hypothetical protein
MKANQGRDDARLGTSVLLSGVVSLLQVARRSNPAYLAAEIIDSAQQFEKPHCQISPDGIEQFWPDSSSRVLECGVFIHNSPSLHAASAFLIGSATRKVKSNLVKSPVGSHSHIYAVVHITEAVEHSFDRQRF